MVHSAGNMVLRTRMYGLGQWWLCNSSVYTLESARRILRYEDANMCCWRSRAVGLKAHALMTLMIVVIQFMMWFDSQEETQQQQLRE